MRPLSRADAGYNDEGNPPNADIAMLDIDFPPDRATPDMPSLNHSYVCSRILRQLFADARIEALTELSLDIDNGLTPDICVYPAECIHPNFSRDVSKLQQMPILAIEVISASQNIQDILIKSERLVRAGVKAAWTVEPFTRTVFVTTPEGETIVHDRIVESEGVRVDFGKIFAG
jgi:Uma2 family endonuclease